MQIDLGRLTRPLSALAVCATLVGCATPAGPKAMVSDSAQVIHQHPYSVAVRTAGGRDTDAMGASQISDASLQAAIADSITATRVFSEVVQGKDGDYVLSVSVVEMEQPVFGFDLTVHMEAGWSLKDVKSGQVVWQNSIRSNHTSTVNDAFAAVARLRLATE